MITGPVLGGGARTATGRTGTGRAGGGAAGRTGAGGGRTPGVLACPPAAVARIPNLGEVGGLGYLRGSVVSCFAIAVSKYSTFYVGVTGLGFLMLWNENYN